MLYRSIGIGDCRGYLSLLVIDELLNLRSTVCDDSINLRTKGRHIIRKEGFPALNLIRCRLTEHREIRLHRRERITKLASERIERSPAFLYR